jgi:hypothetical protein
LDPQALSRVQALSERSKAGAEITFAWVEYVRMNTYAMSSVSIGSRSPEFDIYYAAVDNRPDKRLLLE